MRAANIKANIESDVTRQCDLRDEDEDDLAKQVIDHAMFQIEKLLTEIEEKDALIVRLRAGKSS